MERTMKVRFVKQWRGHDIGAEPELTDERAEELIREGYAVALVEAPPEPVEEPAPSPEDSPSSD